METSLTRLAALLGDSLVEGAVTAARTRSPEVGALPEDEVRRHVRAMVGASAAARTSYGQWSIRAGTPESRPTTCWRASPGSTRSPPHWNTGWCTPTGSP